MPARTPVAALILSLSLIPAGAQELPPAPVPRTDDAPSLMEEGAKLFFRGLMSEMEPAINEMGRLADEIEPALREMGPALRDLAAMMGDVGNYEAPVRMPNGDILIRRKPDAPSLPLLPKGGEIEL